MKAKLLCAGPADAIEVFPQRELDYRHAGRLQDTGIRMARRTDGAELDTRFFKADEGGDRWPVAAFRYTQYTHRHEAER